ncbi:unnamed protein product [marine sediment metagenome]|uniref:Uncharacterized protein n=1 Tax=marine sediment metagenome TaxID=412755 RepID=X1U6E9_9ZZZZ
MARQAIHDETNEDAVLSELTLVKIIKGEKTSEVSTVWEAGLGSIGTWLWCHATTGYRR